MESCLRQNLTLTRYFFEIHHFLLNVEASEDDPCWHTRNNVRNAIFYLDKAVLELVNHSVHLGESMEQCAIVIEEASQASSQHLSINNGVLVAELQIVSQIMSNLTKPEDAIPWCLQLLQKLHDLPAIQKVFSSLGGEETDSVMFIAKSVFKMNRVLFEFVQAFFRPPPTVEEWPVTIQLLDKSIYNPLIENKLMDTEKVVSRVTKLNIPEVDNRVQNPVTFVAGYSFMITESCAQTDDNR